MVARSLPTYSLATAMYPLKEEEQWKTKFPGCGGYATCEKMAYLTREDCCAPCTLQQYITLAIEVYSSRSTGFSQVVKREDKK